jgi:hypothetical protein
MTQFFKTINELDPDKAAQQMQWEVYVCVSSVHIYFPIKSKVTLGACTIYNEEKKNQE